MKTETRIKIREWERERDRNLKIHCPLVAAKYQRWIDKLANESRNRSMDDFDDKFREWAKVPNDWKPKEAEE